MSTLIGKMIDVLAKNRTANGLVFADTQTRKQLGTRSLNALLDSHRFHLSSKTAATAARLGFEADDKNMLMSLARAPFDLTWLEWNLKDQFKGVAVQPAADAPDRVGVLVRRMGDDLYMITSVLPLPEFSEVIVSPVSIVFSTGDELDRDKWSFDRGLLATVLESCTIVNGKPPSFEGAMNIMDACLLGGMQEAQKGNDISEAQRILCLHATYMLTPVFHKPYLDTMLSKELPVELRRDIKRVLSERISESSGLLRFVVGALALINSKEYIEVQTVKPTDKRVPESYGAKRSPVYDFVEFTAPHKVFVRNIIESHTHESKHLRPQHEVIGHFAHSRATGDNNCEHSYEKRGENSWVCLSCGKKRWYRRDHKRGDPNVGIVNSRNRLVRS